VFGGDEGAGNSVGGCVDIAGGAICLVVSMNVPMQIASKAAAVLMSV
jgi:hypothetical protein